MLAPKLRFPKFTDEWQIHAISEIGDIITGNTPSTSDRSLYGDEYPFIGPGDMNNGRYIKSTKQSLSHKGFGSSRVIPAHSTLFVCIGSTIGKIAQTTRSSVTNQQINSIVPNDSYDEDFIFLALDRVAKRIAQMASEQAVPIISKGEFQKNRIYTPQKPEQQKIADFLTTVDKKIESIDKKVELLKQYKKGVMQKIFTQQIQFTNHDGNVYPEWQNYMLGSVLEKSKRRNKGAKYENVQSVSNTHGFVNQKDYFNDHSVASKDLSNYFVIEAGMFAYNPSRIDVGSLAYKSDNDTSVVSPLYVCFHAKNELLEDSFLFSWFFTSAFKKQMNSSFEGSVRNTLSYESLSAMSISLPGIEEQKKIADFLSAIDDKIKAEETKLASAKKFKKALLQRMFV